MIWSFGFQDLNANGPLATGGARFSGASSIFGPVASGPVYFPYTCVGSGPAAGPNALVSAGQNTRLNLTEKLFGSAGSTVMPVIVCARLLRYSSKPTMSWNDPTRIAFLLRATAFTPVR